MMEEKIITNEANYILLNQKICKRFRKRTRLPILKWIKILFYGIVTILLAALIFISIIVPLTFMYSTKLQHLIIFPNRENEYYQDYTNFTKYGVEGVRNFYVTVDPKENVSLGIWHLLPEALINVSTTNEFDFESALKLSNFPSIVYFHGNSGNRIKALKKYSILRKYFHVIAFDYRNYGDSSIGTISEQAMIADSVELYKWLQMKTSSLYIWGHSLGTSLSVSTAARLKDDNIVPMGLFLETPYTSLREASRYHPLGKIVSWLPWYEATIMDPLEKNGFTFKSDTKIQNIDCPIIMMHAEDDQIVNFRFGKKLYEITKKSRKQYQGNVTFHRFPAERQYNHWKIFQAPELPNYIENFITECIQYRNREIHCSL